MNKYTAQAQLEILFNKNQLMPRMREEFSTAEGVLDHLRANKIPIKFGIELMVQMALHKRANVSTLAGCLMHMADDMQELSALLEKAVDADLVDYDTQLGVFVTRYETSPEVQQELDRYQYPLPMLIPPREIVDNRTSGYLNHECSVILKDNHTEDDVCLDHLNRLNSIPLSIDMDTVSMIQNKWKKLDKRKNGETHDEFNKRKRAFAKYDRVSRDILNLFHQQGNVLYLTHRYDKRGRTYCQGYHVNYQGTAWNKAVIRFVQTELPE